MNESYLWTVVREKLSPFGSLARVENKLGLGMPDVVYSLEHPKTGIRGNGWLELKNLARLPARPDTPLVIAHLTKEQVDWARDWTGSVHMLLRAGNWFLLFDPAQMREIYNREMTASQATDVALVCRNGKFPTGDLVRWLTR